MNFIRKKSMWTMYSLLFICLVLQKLLVASQSPDSGVSCVIGTYNQPFVFNYKQFYSVFNKSNVKSIESNIKFLFYSRRHPDGIKFISNDEYSLETTHFDPTKPTKIITHGFNSYGGHKSCLGPVKAFLEKSDLNIFVMDWYKHQTEGFWFPIYWEVIKKLNKVALHLAEMVNFLQKHGMNPNTTTMIGHSLGAHVVGIAGYNTKSKVYHIVGLDPAEPFLNDKGPGERISDQDAHHVEIIHTNGNHCGMLKPLGHYDFYPNGGVKQRGCKNNRCSHQRAHIYFTESIQSSNGFYGRRCPDADNIIQEKCNGDTAIMGGMSKGHISPGIYYVETNEKYPFSMGDQR